MDNRDRRPCRDVERLLPRGLTALTLLGLAFATVDIEAYIDPGTGSYVFQLAFAGILTAAYAVKRYWSQIRERVQSFRNRCRAASRRGTGRNDGRLD